MDVSKKTGSEETLLCVNGVTENWVKPDIFKLNSQNVLGLPGTGSDIGSVAGTTSS